jgi:hypothetical protein
MQLICKFFDYITEADQTLFPILWNQYNDGYIKCKNNDMEGCNLWLSLWQHMNTNI